MEFIDAVLYTLLLVGWICGVYIASVTHFEIFVLIGFAASVIALLWLGIRFIYRRKRKKDTELKRESTIYKCVGCGHMVPYKISSCPKCGAITMRQKPYRIIFSDENGE